MKIISICLVILLIAMSMTACKQEIVTLSCDGEGCANKVEVVVKGKEKPDENWVVFCDKCSNGVMQD